MFLGVYISSADLREIVFDFVHFFIVLFLLVVNPIANISIAHVCFVIFVGFFIVTEVASGTSPVAMNVPQYGGHKQTMGAKLDV